MSWLGRFRDDLVFAAPVIRAAAAATALVGGTALTSTAWLDPRDAIALSVASAAMAVGYVAVVARRLTIPLRELDAARSTLVRRASAMDHLLDFSESLQGITSFDDVFDELSHRLWNELDLAGLAIVANDDPPQGVAQRSQWQVRLCWPDTLEASEAQRLEGKLLELPPELDAHCIRVSIGKSRQYRLHLLMPQGMEWTDHRLQVAQTYVNTAHAVLSMLHHLDVAERLSVTDGLTQLYNRRSMDEMLQREMALARRHGHPLSIVMIDMDRFKEVNDAHGHASGDHLLQTFAECVRLTLRRTDLAFRYGGDEFCIALPNTPVAQAQQVVGKLRYVFSTADFADIIGSHEPAPTLSIGVAERSAHDRQTTAEQLLAAADQALYDAKHAERDCVCVYQQSAG